MARTTRSNNPCENIFSLVTLLVSIVAEIRLFLVSSSLIKTLTSSWNIAQVSKNIEMWQLRFHSRAGGHQLYHPRFQGRAWERGCSLMSDTKVVI